MNGSTATSMQFRLAPASLGYDVEVRLRTDGDRWIANATVRGEGRLGLGATPRAALTAALGALPDRDVTLLLADTMLLAPSIEVARLARSRLPA
jgi:hypothetical protein